MEFTDVGYILEQVYTYITQDMESTDARALLSNKFVNPQNIDRMVEMEMKRIKANLSRKEEQYVEQMLVENPITIERRTNNNSSCSINNDQQQQSEEDVDVVSVTATTQKETNIFLQQQRADACRRSRYNNKIKKAKSKYRHQFMSQKLMQSTQMLDCIQNLIEQAENHLLTKGLTKDKLQHLRRSYGANNATDNVRKLGNVLNMQ